MGHGRLYRSSYRRPDGVRVRTDKLYGEFLDLRRRLRTVALTADETTSRRALDRLCDALDEVRSGGTVDPNTIPQIVRAAYFRALRADGDRRANAEGALRSLVEHVDDWASDLAHAGNTRRHVGLCRSRAVAALTGMGARFWADLRPERLTAYLARRQSDPAERLSVQSANHYVRVCKQFANWLARKLGASSPLAPLKTRNAEADRRWERRAASDAEIDALLASILARGEIWRGVSCADRYWAVRLAVETGIRANEMRSLAVGDFELDADPPTVTVAAASSKRRRADTIPLRRHTAEELRAFLGQRSGSALRMPDKTAAMLRHDMEPARRAWILEARSTTERDARTASDFLVFASTNGVLDWHALRHTFVTRLVRRGLHPKIAQTLARHSTIGLTMDRYTHQVIGDMAAALESLPAVGAVTMEFAAVGTDDRTSAMPRMEKHSPRNSPRSDAQPRNILQGCTAAPIGAAVRISSRCNNMREHAESGAARETSAQRFSKPQVTGSNPVAGFRSKAYKPQDVTLETPTIAEAPGSDHSTRNSLRDGAQSCETLRNLVAAWSGLPTHVRAAIAALVEGELARNADSRPAGGAAR